MIRILIDKRQKINISLILYRCLGNFLRSLTFMKNYCKKDFSKLKVEIIYKTLILHFWYQSEAVMDAFKMSIILFIFRSKPLLFKTLKQSKNKNVFQLKMWS